MLPVLSQVFIPENSGVQEKHYVLDQYSINHIIPEIRLKKIRNKY